MRYRIDSSRVTFQEFRSEASIPTSMLAWIITRLRIPLAGSSDHPTVDELGPFRVAETDIPAEVLADFAAGKSEFAQLGFRGTVYHRIVDPRSHTEIYYASYLHKSGGVVGRLTRRVFAGTTPPKTFLRREFFTALGDGRFLGTVTGKGDLQGPESIDDEYLGEVSSEELWNRHKQRLAEANALPSVQRLTDGRELLRALERRHRVITDEFVRRGLFVPVNESEEAAAASNAEAPTAAAPAPAPNAAGVDPLLYAEVRKLEDSQQTSWLAPLLVLLVSAAAFVGAGGLLWSWKFVLLLVPILLVHELGHYLAMKLFDYRNVQMFFIPLFGAAVSGRHYNVPGWKRVVTSLMGPVPGIGIGIGLGIAGLWEENDALLEAGTLAVIINGFNLLPALPLDGGWVLHGLLFSRHAFLDLLFRLLAIGLLFFGVLLGGGKLLMFIGIAMVIALPASFHTARITDRLRAASEPIEPPQDGHVPASAVGRIAAELDSAYPKGLDCRTKARLALQIFENVNSRPPGWVASIVLGLIYVASLLTAVLASFLLVLAQHADLGQLMVEAAFGPQRSLVVSEIISNDGAVDAAAATMGDALVVNFAKPDEAQEAFSGIAADQYAILFGASIFITLPADMPHDERDALFDRFEQDAEAVFVVGPEGGVSLHLAAIAPTADEASVIEAHLSEHFAIPASLHPIAPWEPGKSLTADQRRARRTAARLVSNEWLLNDDGESADSIAHYEKLDAATRRGNKRRIRELQAMERKRLETARSKFLSALRDDPSGEIDTQVIDAFEQALESLATASAEPTDQDDYLGSFPPTPEPSKWMEPIANRFGCHSPDARPAPYASGDYNSASSNGPILSISASFKSLPAGPIQLARWLGSQGCVDLKYELHQESW